MRRRRPRWWMQCCRASTPRCLHTARQAAARWVGAVVQLAACRLQRRAPRHHLGACSAAICTLTGAGVHCRVHALMHANGLKQMPKIISGQPPPHRRRRTRWRGGRRRPRSAASFPARLTTSSAKSRRAREGHWDVLRVGVRRALVWSGNAAGGGAPMQCCSVSCPRRLLTLLPQVRATTSTWCACRTWRSTTRRWVQQHPITALPLCGAFQLRSCV